MKRAAYLSALQVATHVRGKTPVYIDETGFSGASFREYAYARKGLCVEDKAPSNRYKRTTLIAARIRECFTAPVLFDGSCDALVFNIWLQEMLCSLLDGRHAVILDNASFHKEWQTVALIEGSGASLLFLPPYSPELNPIEKDFANLKRIRPYNTEATLDEIIKMYQ